MKKPWKPRASKLGNYIACLWRAVQDRMEYEGLLPPGTQKKERDDTSYADFGDCVHFTLQDGARCEFAKQENPDEADIETAADHFGGDKERAKLALQQGNPQAYQPTAKAWQSAAKLFGGNPSEVEYRARQTAALALTYLPKCPSGVWTAEQQLETEYLTGHMDFLDATTGADGVDLKTAAQKPTGQRMKASHLYQMVGYHLLTGRRLQRCPVLYVDSQDADWCVLVPCDLTTDSAQYLADQVESFCQFLMSDRLMEVAYPSIGDHCHRSWCDWAPGCKDWFMPPPGRFFSAAKQRTPTGLLRPPPVRR